MLIQRTLVSLLLGGVVSLLCSWLFSARIAFMPPRGGRMATFFDTTGIEVFASLQEDAGFAVLRISRERLQTVPAGNRDVLDTWLDHHADRLTDTYPYWMISPSRHRTLADDHGSWTEVATGWPFLSMRYTLVGRWRGKYTFAAPKGIPIDMNRGTRPFALPVEPIWPGFLANTAFFGSLAFMLLCIHPLRLRRRFKGRCARCGYDLRHSAGACPECGAAIRRRPSSLPAKD